MRKLFWGRTKQDADDKADGKDFNKSRLMKRRQNSEERKFKRANLETKIVLFLMCPKIDTEEQLFSGAKNMQYL